MTGSSAATTPTAPSGRRLYLTVLFCDVSGSSEHAEQQEAEDYARWLQRFRDVAREIVPRHGGAIARLQGDGVLALFGTPEPREDDGRRATEAALELHAAAQKIRLGPTLDARLRLHSGVHAGLLLLLQGDIELGRFDVVGEVPNTAARLCSMAAADEILVSAETLGPQAHLFRMAPRGRLAIRGRSTELEVLSVEGRAAVERRIDSAARRGLVPFVGRSAALLRLQSALQRLVAGQSVALELVGEAGIGKTRLIDEFRRRLDADALLVLHGSCESYLAAEPLQPFKQALRQCLGWRLDASPAENERALARHAAGIDTTGPTWAAARAIVGAPGAADARAPAVVELVAHLAGARPVVLLLDDWQWADDASRQTLAAMRARELPLMVLTGRRSGVADIDDDDRELLALPPLALADAQSAISAWLPSADPFVVQDIHLRSGGSPLYIEELCQAASSGGALQGLPRGSGVAWLNALVASRLAHLPPAELELLQLAAVAGSVFPAWLLGSLLPGADVPKQVEALVLNDFLAMPDDSGQLRFKHALTRDAVYAMVDLDRRRALHLRVAQALEAAAAGERLREQVEAIAYHYDSAEFGDEAARYAEAAGDKALSAVALDRARYHYTAALRWLDRAAAASRDVQLRWCAIAQRLGQTCVFDPLDVAHDLGLFERAVALARRTGDEGAIARAEYWLGYLNYGKGRPRLAVRHSEAALEHALASGDERLIVQVQATLGQSLASAGRYARALPLLEQVVDAKRRLARPGSGTAVGSAYSLARRGYSLGDIGRFAEARRCFDEALELIGPVLHPVGASVHELICVVQQWQGRWADAREAGLKGVDIALRCRSHYLVSMGRALAASADWAATRDAQALQTLRDATEWIATRGGAVSTSLNYGWLTEAAASLGLEAEMRRHAARVFQRARLGDRHGLTVAYRALAGDAARRGAFGRAERWLAAAQRSAAARGSDRDAALNELACAQLLAAAGRTLPARQQAEQARQQLQRLDMPWFADRALDALRQM